MDGASSQQGSCSAAGTVSSTFSCQKANVTESMFSEPESKISDRHIQAGPWHPARASDAARS